MKRMVKVLRYAVGLALMPLGYVLLGLIRGYQYVISPMFPPTCRFLPSCSHYAGEALRVHGPVRGLGLALWRLARCNPWGGHGHDPVPEARCPEQASRRGKTDRHAEGQARGMS